MRLSEAFGFAREQGLPHAELERSDVAGAGGTRPLALGAASEGDFYILPGLLGELFHRESDWDVRNLGVNLPLRSPATAVQEYRPWLVFLTLSDLVDEERFMRESLSFHENAVARGVAVIVGGQEF